MENRKRFVWHDLMTTDVEGARRFYGELFGWQLKKEEQGPYTLILSGGKDIGGVMPFAKPNIPSHWIGYVAVEDIDDTLAKIKAAQGIIHQDKMDIPNIGKFAVAQDPQGGVFAPFQFAAPKAETEEKPELYRFCWDELMVPDTDAAVKFYGDVIGWETESMAMPGFGTYTLWKRPGLTGMSARAGGLMKRPPEVPHSFWLTYVSVADCDATVEKAKRLGGTAATPPMDIPNVGRFATLVDPQGAAIAILAPKM